MDWWNRNQSLSKWWVEEIMEKKGAAHDPKPKPHLSNMVVALMGLGHVWLPVEMAQWQLLRISLLTSSRMNTEVYRSILFDQIQPNASKLIRWHFIIQQDNDPKHQPGKAQSFLGWKGESLTGQVSHLISIPLPPRVLCFKRALSPTQFFLLWCKHTQIKAETWNFTIVSINVFQIECAEAKSLKNKKCLTVQIHAGL